MDVTKAVQDIKAGKIEYRLDKTNIIHVPIGKASFSRGAVSGQLPDAYRCYQQSKTKRIEGNLFKERNDRPTMGPGVKINTMKPGLIIN